MTKIPYFYVIQHISSDRYYAGCRFAKDATPNELLKTYFTSSPRVHNIIANEGIDAFKIVKIKERSDAHDYETRFLKRVDAAKNPKFLNSHNNDGLWVSAGEERYKQIMIEKYGVDHNFKLPETRAKIEKTCAERYGVSNWVQSEDFKVKSRETFMNNYGVDHPMKSESVVIKLKKSNIERYGVENVFMIDEVKRKIEETSLRRYGTRHPKQSNIVKANCIESSLEKYGVEHHIASEEVRKKAEETILKNRGVDHAWKCPIARAKQEETMLKRYGARHSAQSEVVQALVAKRRKAKYSREIVKRIEKILIDRNIDPKFHNECLGVKKHSRWKVKSDLELLEIEKRLLSQERNDERKIK